MDEESKRYVVKFYRPERWSSEQITEEHQFSLDLAESEIPVIAPLRLNGKTLHTHCGFFFAVFLALVGVSMKLIILTNWSGLGVFLAESIRPLVIAFSLPAQQWV